MFVFVFQTTVPCIKAGRFHCQMVVSMRPVPQHKLETATLCTHAILLAHGGPVHIGDPSMCFFKENLIIIALPEVLTKYVENVSFKLLNRASGHP